MCFNTVKPDSVKLQRDFVIHDIQGVSGGIVNVLGGGSMDYSE